MNTVAFLLALMTSVSALAPTMVSTSPFGKIAIPRKSSPKSTVPDEDKPLTERLGGVGVTKPFPEGFDPLGFASRADKQQMYKFREAELKHGRVAMLAVPGFLLSEDFHPFFPTLPKWEYGIFALQDTLEQPAGIIGLAGAVLAIGAFEARSFKSFEVPEGTLGSAKSTYFKMKVPEEKDGFLLVPGATLPAGPWSQLPQDEFVAKQNAELNNGRLAMISIFLIVMQEVVSKLPAAEFDAQTLDFLGGLLNTPGMFFE